MNSKSFLSFVLLAGFVFSAPFVPVAAQPAPTTYFCPMHPDVTAPAPGTCRKCGMALTPGNPFEMSDYRLEIEATPRAPKAGEPVRLRFRVFHPVSGSQVQQFEIVHDAPYHLFVISQDMAHFQHLHPEQQADGSFQVALILPQPGYYKVFSDFLPAGGAPQVIARPIATAGFAGDLGASLARLAPDLSLDQVADGMRVALSLEPREPIAGREATLAYHLVDERSGRPIDDLQPYLGAWGHTVIVSEDMIDYLHTHPVDKLPGGDGATTSGRAGPPLPVAGGPDVTFDAFFPKPGNYRVWTQFKRQDRLTTVSFVIRVSRLGSSITGSRFQVLGSRFTSLQALGSWFPH